MSSSQHASSGWFRLAVLALFTGVSGALVAQEIQERAPSEISTSPAQETPAVGSLRHARVAIATEGGKKPLVYLARSMAESDLAELKALAPNLRILTPGSQREALQWAPQVHGVDGRYCTPEFVRAAKQLVWVQAPSAGVDRYLTNQPLMSTERVVLTNMQGVHGAAIADHVFAMLLTLTRDLRFHLHAKQRGSWNRRGSGIEPIALSGKTLLVVGLGGIGREVAQRGKGFGMHVLATRRSAVEAPPYVDFQGTPEQLPALLGQADVIVLCLPLTEETRGMIDAKAMSQMKQGAFLVNIARGRIMDTEALTLALQSGHLAGACLDVTDPEPLPADHPLWSMDNVVITPHVAGRAALTSKQWNQVYRENLRRFAAGEPLLNVVDKKAGY
ncbi:MAG: D-2-hydroxyacid dehydrogenase [Planctomycetota bacterium]|nr:MAG: D-2-hydroxyacid dehydrogenase [Planctomycetota bacterium]